jgi:hypothetical protein
MGSYLQVQTHWLKEEKGKETTATRCGTFDDNYFLSAHILTKRHEDVTKKLSVIEL